jgi:hypothetical protein
LCSAPAFARCCFAGGFVEAREGQDMRLTVFVCSLSLVASAAAALALDPADKCESSKLKTAGKYAFCRSKAESKAVTTGGMPDFSKCDEKYSFKWQLAETNGSGMCPSNGDEAALKTFITLHTDDVAVALAGGPLPNCPADLATCNADLTTCSGDLSTCSADLANALACGNGAIDGGEDCDQANVNGETCITQGFAGGTLACGQGCSFDTSGCWNARFMDNGNGTITDNATGLMWEKKVALDGSGVSCVSAATCPDPHDAENTYSWSDPFTPTTFSGTAMTVLLAQLNDAAGGGASCFANRCDWRLPTRPELESIVDLADMNLAPVTDIAFHGVSCGAACTDLSDPACSCTRPSSYWSASPFAPTPGNAWVVNFSFGILSLGAATDSYYVRAVRGGS